MLVFDRPSAAAAVVSCIKGHYLSVDRYPRTRRLRLQACVLGLGLPSKLLHREQVFSPQIKKKKRSSRRRVLRVMAIAGRIETRRNFVLIYIYQRWPARRDPRAAQYTNKYKSAKIKKKVIIFI